MSEKRKTVTAREAAEQLNVHPRTIARYAKAGILEGYKTNPYAPSSDWNIYQDSIDRFIKARHGTATPQ